MRWQFKKIIQKYHFVARKKYRLFLIALTAIAIAAAGTIVVLQGNNIFETEQGLLAALGTENQKSLKKYADKVLMACLQSGHPGDRRLCYEREVPRLMDTISMTDAFEVTRLIQKKDPTYLWCHNMGHQLSEREYYKDPTRWKEIIGYCPVGTCSNGCIHGTTQAYFRDAAPTEGELNDILGELQSICEVRPGWSPTGLEEASCYHELGHSSLFLTNSDVGKAAEICDKIAIKDDGRNFLGTCKEGIFMQIFEPRVSEDFALIYDLVPIKENLVRCENLDDGEAKGACWEGGWEGKAASFCNQFVGLTKNACFREAWVVYDKEELQTPEGLLEYCSYSEELSEQRICYNKLFYSLMAFLEFDEEAMKQICLRLPQKLKSQCLANMASRMIETDKELIEEAVGICTFAATHGVEEECFRELLHYSTFAFHPGSDSFFRLCGSLPAPWDKKCLERLEN